MKIMVIKEKFMQRIIFFICFFLFSGALFSQEIETSKELAPQERNIFADTGYALLDIEISNLIFYAAAKIYGADFTNITTESMARNLSPKSWVWEDGDRFIINQFGHPYQGSTYFISACANGFNFYESLLFLPIGSILWETLHENVNPSINDLITTVTGGMAVGEMLHRLFLEVDASPHIGAKIGGVFVSPMSSINKIYNRAAREQALKNIYDLSLKTGVEKSFAYFSKHESEAASWRYPNAYVEVNVVYGNPFVQESAKPYDHFELNAGLTINIDSYHFNIISDGYIFSVSPSQTEDSFTSTGLTLHYDFFNATNDPSNADFGNINFSSSAVDWTVKHVYNFSQNSVFEIKAHAGFTFWGNTVYNTEIDSGKFWGNSIAAYGIGENLKLFFIISNNKAGKLELAVLGYHIFSMPVNENHSAGNVFFINCFLSYDFLFTEKIGIGVKPSFWGLFGLYDSVEDVNRTLASISMYANIKF